MYAIRHHGLSWWTASRRRLAGGDCGILRELADIRVENTVIVCPLRPVNYVLQDNLLSPEPVQGDVPIVGDPIPVRSVRERHR
jgi:hypothetical protein